MNDILGFNLRDVINKFLIDLRQAFTSPSSDPMLTVMVTGILLVVITAVVLLIVLIYLFVTRGRRVILYTRTRVSESDIWISRLFMLLFIVLLVFTANYYTERDKSCMNCHAEQLEKRALEQSSHAGLKCVTCHRPPGISGYLQQKIDFLRMVGVYTRLENKESIIVRAGSVGNDVCLRCHSSVLEEAVEAGNLLVSHVEINQANLPCVDCHSQTAHPGITKPVRKVEMTDCARCHDGQKADNKCSTCHPLNEEGIDVADVHELPKVSLTIQYDCYGECHDEKKECLVCHGVSMPHPDGWVNGPYSLHIRYAGFTGKQLCWRCHYPKNEGKYLKPDPEFCGRCHPINFHGRDEDVFYAHQRFTRAQCTGLCHNFNFCHMCHGEKIPREPLPEKVKNAPFTFPETEDF